MRRLLLVSIVALAVAAPAAARVPRDDPDPAPAAAVTAVSVLVTPSAPSAKPAGLPKCQANRFHWIIGEHTPPCAP